MMNCFPHIVVIVLGGMLRFIFVRGYIGLIINYCLNTSAGKKRRKGQSFKEWLTFSRYRDIIPYKFMVFYYSYPLIYVLSIFAILIMAICNFGHDETMFFCSWVLFLLDIPIVIMFFRFFNFKTRSYDASRVIDRKKRNKK